MHNEMLNVPSYYKTLFKIRELNSFAVLKIKEARKPGHTIISLVI